jgi:hypothetical protein
MKLSLQVLLSTALFLHLHLSCLSQSDSLRKKDRKTHIYVSAMAGIPVYNKFVYDYFWGGNTHYESNSKKKLICGVNVDFDIHHLTLNLLTNYSQNEFSGKTYSLQVFEPRIRLYDIYQRVQYNYFQIGTGLGYNISRKKHFFSLTANVMCNLITDIRFSSFYSPESGINDKDTIYTTLAKNYKSNDVSQNFELFANLRFIYSYALSKRFRACVSLNAALGALGNRTLVGYPTVDSYSLGYFILQQKVVYPQVGIKYRLL